jgi:hypothetical protein
MQFVTLSEKCTKNTIRKHISQAFFWCLCRNWQIMLGCPLGGCFLATLHGVSSPQRRFASLMVSGCHPRIRHPQHVSVLKDANIMLQATFTHFSCRWCCPSFQLRTRVRLVEHVRILTITTSCDIVFSHGKWTGRSGLRSLQARTVTCELGTRTLQHGLNSAVGLRFRQNRWVGHTKCLPLLHQ